MANQLTSDHFSLDLIENPDDEQQPLTLVTLRYVHFIHTPLLLLPAEVRNLRELLNQWDEQGDRAKDALPQDGIAEHCCPHPGLLEPCL
ncbi:MAG: hypothetical protein BroJett011_42880 [Chloroflexota bacterium]|nr:MAG: hypothetical protein BroJett011_42880 [Chloroflexota bacterium]